MQKQAKRRVREIEGILNLRKVAACRSLFLGHNCTNKVFLLQLQRYFSCLSLCLGQNSKVSILQLQSISLAEVFFLARIALAKYSFCTGKVFLLQLQSISLAWAFFLTRIAMAKYFSGNMKCIQCCFIFIYMLNFLVVHLYISLLYYISVSWLDKWINWTFRSSSR